MLNYHKGYETTVTAFCFALLTMYRFPNRFVLTQRKRPNFSSIFLFRVTLAAIISSNRSRNLFTLKLYSGAPAREARQRSTMGKKIWLWRSVRPYTLCWGGKGIRCQPVQGRSMLEIARCICETHLFLGGKSRKKWRGCRRVQKHVYYFIA